MTRTADDDGSRLPPRGGFATGLVNDLYQLTMAQGYLASGLAEREAVFHLTFRSNPFGGGFSVCAGLEPALAWLESMRFRDDDLAYLATLQGYDGAPLFQKDFLATLGGFRFTCDVDAVPEGTVVFPRTPLIRVRGPLLQCQLVETALLNLVNFSTLVATKAARIRLAAGMSEVLEFGLRRAQGFDGGLTASRAAFVGGADATSNVLAGREFGIPVRGTHAHSWVMAFDDELESFTAFADTMPNNCVLLVDTYDTERGIDHAIQVGHQLRERGYALGGVRLDSGDFGQLARLARDRLDAAGFPETKIVASNDLDEHAIAALERADAPITVWGVGTKLSTGAPQAALGGVYKLAALRDTDGTWRRVMKVSEEAAKRSDPGIHQVRRYFAPDGPLADVVYDVELGVSGHASDPLTGATVDITRATTSEDLLVPAWRGHRVYPRYDLADVRRRTLAQLAMLPPGIARLDDAACHPVGLDTHLLEIVKQRLDEGNVSEAAS